MLYRIYNPIRTNISICNAIFNYSDYKSLYSRLSDCCHWQRAKGFKSERTGVTTRNGEATLRYFDCAQQPQAQGAEKPET